MHDAFMALAAWNPFSIAQWAQLLLGCVILPALVTGASRRYAQRRAKRRVAKAAYLIRLYSPSMTDKERAEACAAASRRIGAYCLSSIEAVAGMERVADAIRGRRLASKISDPP